MDKNHYVYFISWAATSLTVNILTLKFTMCFIFLHSFKLCRLWSEWCSWVKWTCVLCERPARIIIKWAKHISLLFRKWVFPPRKHTAFWCRDQSVYDVWKNNCCLFTELIETGVHFGCIIRIVKVKAGYQCITMRSVIE